MAPAPPAVPAWPARAVPAPALVIWFQFDEPLPLTDQSAAAPAPVNDGRLIRSGSGSYVLIIAGVLSFLPASV